MSITENKRTGWFSGGSFHLYAVFLLNCFLSYFHCLFLMFHFLCLLVKSVLSVYSVVCLKLACLVFVSCYFLFFWGVFLFFFLVSSCPLCVVKLSSVFFNVGFSSHFVFFFPLYYTIFAISLNKKACLPLSSILVCRVFLDLHSLNLHILQTFDRSG